MSNPSDGDGDEPSIWQKRRMEKEALKASKATDEPTPAARAERKQHDDLDEQERKVQDSIMGMEEEIEEMNYGDDNDIDFSEVDGDLLKFQKDDIVKEALSKGVDLRNYSRQIESELQDAEVACVADYIRDADSLASLHNQIGQCDGILERMQGILSQFQGDLGAISSEIKYLQDRSMAMSVQLKNRKEAEQRLSSFINSLVVAPDLVTQICEDEVNDAYVEYLVTLNNKIHVLQLPDIRHAQAAVDVMPTIETLRLKAMSRVRQFLLQRISAFRKPKTNIQIKQDLLLKFTYFYEFLLDQSLDNKDVSAEIREEYVDTMSKRYYAHFKSYLSNMKKLQTDNDIDRNDLLTTDESKSGGFFASKKTTRHMNRVFSLSHRQDVMDQIGSDPIMYHVAQKNEQRFPYEYIMRSAQHLLMDTATSEYAFIVEFFGHKKKETQSTAASAKPGGRSKDSHAIQMFNLIFAKTISLFLESLENYLFGCYDSIGLLLMIRVVWKHNNIMQSRKVACLDSFFDRINMLLWPRFKTVFDMNVEAVTQYKPAMAKGATVPHYITMRYAQFENALSTLNQGYNDTILNSNQRRLRFEIEKMLLAMADQMSSAKEKMVFLINNYDAVLQVMSMPKPVESEATRKFQEMRGAQIGLYVEEELAEKFGKLIQFVKSSEYALANKARSMENDEAKGQAKIKLDETQVEGIVKHFAKFWRDGIERINGSVTKNFAFRLGDQAGTGAGPEILKQVLIQLVLYYQRFQDILKKCFTAMPGFTKDLVPIPTIMYEVKKYAR